jgi:DNA-binding transcriptional MerR regulator
MRSYKIGEASKILGVHPNTLRKWEKEGKIMVMKHSRSFLKP